MSNLDPKNIILYGPPGTGKTYATTELAVKLCGARVPRDRTKLGDVYRNLLNEGRIEFVTFHQSMSYEDFIEGLYPIVQSSESKNSLSSGFHLEAKPGVFRKIVDRAVRNFENSLEWEPISISDRNIFKLSFVDSKKLTSEEIFDEAIKNECIYLNVSDPNFGDKRYREQPNIQNFVKRAFGDSFDPVDCHNMVVELNYLRNISEKGDIFVVPKDDLSIQAVGVVVGDYEFVPGATNGLFHRRKVRWHWVDKNGLKIDGIFEKELSPFHPFYSLSHNIVDAKKIESLINSPSVKGKRREQRKNFVIVIDEINRANISKVFGELITLIEPSKRLGSLDEISVTLPYSGDRFGIPLNLHIVGTMNTADRSVSLIDSALRRRFLFQEMQPDSSLLGVVDGVNLSKLLDVINERIEYLCDREHRIGHGYFINCKSKSDVDSVMKYKVIPLLADYFFDDWDKVAIVLGDFNYATKDKCGGFLELDDLGDLPGSDYQVGNRNRWSVLSDINKFSYENLVQEDES